MEIEPTAELVVTSADKEVRYYLPKKAARGSKIFASMMEDDEEEERSEIPIVDENVSKALGKIVEFLKHCVDDPMMEIPTPLPRESPTLRGIVQEWYEEFINEAAEDLENLTTLTRAANYLDVPPLLKLCIARLACILLSAESPEDMKKLLNVTEDISPEEERAIRENNRWIFDFDLN